MRRRHLRAIAWDYNLPTRIDGRWCWTERVEGDAVIGGAFPLRIHR